MSPGTYGIIPHHGSVAFVARLPLMALPESFSGIRSDSTILVDTKVDTPSMDTRYAVQNMLFGANLCANQSREPFRRLTFGPVLYRQAKFLFHMPRHLIAPSGQLMAARRRVSPLPATAAGRHQDKHNITNRPNLFKTGLLDYEVLKTIQSQAVHGLGAGDVSTLGVHSVLTSINLSATVTTLKEPFRWQPPWQPHLWQLFYRAPIHSPLLVTALVTLDVLSHF